MLSKVPDTFLLLHFVLGKTGQRYDQFSSENIIVSKKVNGKQTCTRHSGPLYRQVEIESSRLRN